MAMCLEAIHSYLGCQIPGIHKMSSYSYSSLHERDKLFDICFDKWNKVNKNPSTSRREEQFSHPF